MLMPRKPIRGMIAPFAFQQVDVSLIKFQALPGPEARALRAKTIGPVISDCGLRISDFFGFLFQSAFRNRHSAIWWRAYRAPQIRNVELGISWFLFSIPHSALSIPHFHRPPDPKNETCLMVFARNALPSGPQAFFFAEKGIREGKEDKEILSLGR
jgi:hypothetical protein